jgi:hypothetical protein
MTPEKQFFNNTEQRSNRGIKFFFEKYESAARLPSTMIFPAEYFRFFSVALLLRVSNSFDRFISS